MQLASIICQRQPRAPRVFRLQLLYVLRMPVGKRATTFPHPFQTVRPKRLSSLFQEPLSSDDKDHTLGSSAHVRIVNPPIDFQSGRAIQLHTPSVVLLLLLVLLGPRGRCSVSGDWCPSQACALILHYPDWAPVRQGKTRGKKFFFLVFISRLSLAIAATATGDKR